MALLTALHTGSTSKSEATVGVSFYEGLVSSDILFVGCVFGSKAANEVPPTATLIGCVIDDGRPHSISSSDALVKGLRDGDETERCDVVDQIKDKSATPYLPLLCTRLTDPSWLVRSHAIGAAQQIWREQAPASALIARTLLYGLGDEHSLVTMAAQDFMKSLPAGSSYSADVVAEIASPQQTLRAYALRALLALQEVGFLAGQNLTEKAWSTVLVQSSVDIKLLALSVLARIEHNCPIGLIQALTTDSHYEIRAAAQERLDEM